MNLRRLGLLLGSLWSVLAGAMWYAGVREPFAWYAVFFVSFLLFAEFSSGFEALPSLPTPWLRTVVSLGLVGWLLSLVFYLGWVP